MNFLYKFIPGNLIEAFGWTILHSLWQGVLIGFLLFVVLLLLNKKSARLRYIVAVGALLIMTAISIRTFTEYYSFNYKPDSNTAANNVQQIILLTSDKAQGKNHLPENAGVIYQIGEDVGSYFVGHLPLIVSLYLLGVLFLTFKLLGGYLYTQRIKHRKINEVDKKYQNLVNRISEMLQIQRYVQLFESALVSVPVTIGHFKPVVLLPIGTLTGMSYDQLEAILAHELSHIKRADYIVNFFQSVIEVVFFYHPLVWWISSIIKDERENICDDLALEICGSKSSLVKALVKVSEFESTKQTFAMSVIGNNNKLLRRVKRMMGEKKNKSLRSKVFAASIILFAIISFGFMACSSANGQNLNANEDNDISLKNDDSVEMVRSIFNTDDKEEEYIFFKNVNGQKNKWDATLRDGKIVKILKDGEPLAKSDFDKYENMIANVKERINYDPYAEENGYEDYDTYQDDDNVETVRSVFVRPFHEEQYVFYKTVDGKRSKWDATMKDGKIKKILRDGKEITKSDFYKYEDMIYDAKNNVDFDTEEYFNAEDKDYHEGHRHNHHHGIHIKFDDKYHEEMQKLRDELQTTFNSDEFRESMKQLKEELKDLDIRIDNSFNSDEFRRDMKKLQRQLRHIKVDVPNIKIDLSGLDENMRELRKKLQNIDIDLAEVKTKVAILKDFVRDLKSEMIKDGFLDEGEKIEHLRFEDDAMYINHKKVPDNLYKKYREIYKKYYDEYPDEDSLSISSHL